MDIVVKGRRAEVNEKFRQHAIEKLSRVERLDHRIIRLDVEVSEERNPRQSGNKERVEVTCVSKGPVIRAEAAAPDEYAALDLAIAKLEARLRRAADRRRVHHGAHTPASVRNGALVPESSGPADADGEPADASAPLGQVVREKTIEAEHMTADDAVLQMELIGHDFFLFADKETGAPSVVYRRKGYDYGVIRIRQ
jgi:ribosomal subunit interface protein